MGLLAAGSARAEVFHSRESALKLAFPAVDSVEKRDLVLSAGDAERISKQAGSALPSRLVTAYVGWKGGTPAGCAFIETHRVRSLPETVMFVVGADGALSGVHMLAFHEPPEYAPPVRWLLQFAGARLNERLSLRGDIDGITGASLTANAVTAAARRVLAIYEVAVKPALPADDGRPGE
jgi:hypothetical protein